MGTSTWHPKWWSEESHGSAWGRVKDAMKRDWEQTKADLHLGGKELDQDVDDTLKQVAGKDAIPPAGQKNEVGGTPVTAGGSITWDDAEHPLAFGHGARQQFGAEHAQWNEGLEQRLEADWSSAMSQSDIQRKWNEVRHLVRRGYDYPPK